MCMRKRRSAQAALLFTPVGLIKIGSMDDLPSMIEAHAKPRGRMCRAVFDSPLRIVIAFALIVVGFCAAD